MDLDHFNCAFFLQIVKKAGFWLLHVRSQELVDINMLQLA